MFHIKICGITSVEDALVVAQAGADAIGLNFYPRSPRHVSLDTAREIIAALPRGVTKVGLFVNAQLEYVCKTVDDLSLDLIQLHGDETPDYLAQFGERPVMRAFRVAPGTLQPVLDYLAACRKLAAEPKLALLDPFVPGEYGGTGHTADWSVAQQFAAQPNTPPLVLAGGLTPSNVAKAIAAVHPAAVDVATGVESTPGRKDPAAVQSFIQAAKSAFHA